MYRKILLSIALMVLIAGGLQANPLPFSMSSSVDVTVGNDGNLRPNANKNGYDLDIADIANKRRVTLVSFDVSSLQGGLKMLANVSLSSMGIYGGKVDVYGVVEDADNVTDSVTWGTAPGVIAAPLGYPVVLDAADLTDLLLTIDAPADRQRASSGANQALTDFVNTDTDGIVTFLLAPHKASPFLKVRSFCEPPPPPPPPPPPLAPEPNPMTWAEDPHIKSISTIAMTATTATTTDDSGIEYYFACLTAGGNDSGWQASPNYTDSGLAPDKTYEYQVKARNTGNLAETEYSVIGSATLLEAYVKPGGVTDVTLVSSKYAGGGILLEGEVTTGLTVLVVTEETDRDGDGVFDDQGLVDWLDAEAHNVDARRGYWMELDPNKVEELNAADLVIVSRATNSGNYDDGDEPTMWNSVTAPMVNMTAYLTRNSRWKWVDNATIASLGAPVMQVVEPISSVVFDGIALDPNTMMVDVLDPMVGSADPNDPNVTGNTSFLMTTDVGNGRLMAVAQTADGEAAWIATWLPGVEYYPGAAQFAGGKRMLLMAGTQEPPLQGAFNLNETGQAILANSIILMVQAPVKAADQVHQYTFEVDANDVVGEAHGELVGGAAVVDGAMVTTAQDQWMSMPGDVIAMNAYAEVTIEAFYTPTAGANTSWSMLAYFGGNANGLGSNGFFITSARGDDKSRAAISIGDEASPWASESGADGPELDDGLPHQMAGSITATDIALYIDGRLISSTPLSPTNMISGISTDLALLAKGGYDGDPEWIGAIDEFNVYNRALSLDEIEGNYQVGAE